MQWCLNLLEGQILVIVLHLQMPTASKVMHKASSGFTESHKSAILAICSKLSGFAKRCGNLKTEEVVLCVLPVLVSTNCPSVYRKMQTSVNSSLFRV